MSNNFLALRTEMRVQWTAYQDAYAKGEWANCDRLALAMKGTFAAFAAAAAADTAAHVARMRHASAVAPLVAPPNSPPNAL
jgi:hypothetical protein